MKRKDYFAAGKPHQREDDQNGDPIEEPAYQVPSRLFNLFDGPNVDFYAEGCHFFQSFVNQQPAAESDDVESNQREIEQIPIVLHKGRSARTVETRNTCWAWMDFLSTQQVLQQQQQLRQATPLRRHT